MKSLCSSLSVMWLIVAAAVNVCIGCRNAEIDLSEYAKGPTPLRSPSPAAEGCKSHEDRLTGGQVFEMYCSYCHNAPQLAERNFANFKNVASHMRVRANLTGKEYAKLMEFLRRWNDVPPPHPTDEPTPTRLTFPQPINELRPALPEPLPKDDKKP